MDCMGGWDRIREGKGIEDRRGGGEKLFSEPKDMNLATPLSSV